MASGITQNVIPLGDFGLQRRDRTSAAGVTKSRYTVSIDSEILLHDFNELPLGQGPAEAIAATFMRKMQGILAPAAPSTLDRRKRAAKELARGEPSAVARYSGGRTGVTPPSTTSMRLFNDSDRFSKGFFVMRNKQESGFTVNVPANRLDPTTFKGGEPAMAAMYQRLVALVPEFGNAALLLESPEVVKAIEDGIKGLIGASEGRLAAAKAQQWKLAITAVRGLGGLGRQIAGL